MSRVTKETEIFVNSVFANYSDVFDEFDSQVRKCRECRGTGMDRDEIYECPDCGGEGEVSLALFDRLS